MSKVLYHHKWMDLCANANDEAFVQMKDAVLMIPVNANDEIVLIKEKSIAYGDTMLNLPTGGINEDETPKAAAERELQEEIGYKAGKWERIGILHPSLKYAHWRCWVYLARDLTVHKLKGDEKSPIRMQPVRQTEVSHLIERGKIKDSTAVAALFMALNHIKTSQA
ncbi:MAG: NUDIX domain-containing protein [Anaerolineaceae bacterium]|nr:NUDIX domain-containing protein [Anaerolineaceae bacterium]